MNKQVLDIEQMQHLQELGLELGDTILYWGRCNDHNPRAATHYGKWILSKGNIGQAVGFRKWEFVPAYTLQDILDLLPESIKMDGEEYYLVVEKDAVMYVLWTGAAQMTKVFGKGKCINNPQPLIDYAYEMLCWCIENGYVETSKQDKS